MFVWVISLESNDLKSVLLNEIFQRDAKRSAEIVSRDEQGLKEFFKALDKYLLKV